VRGAETIYQGISGGPDLIAWFGRVPSFHDAEIVNLNLVRRATSSLSVHAWNMTQEIDSRGYFILDRHAVVAFTFDEIIDLQLDSFNHQNVVGELSIRRAADRQDRRTPDHFSPLPDDYDLEIVPCYGLHGFIRCRNISIRFAPGKPDNAVV
jgi:hypothetical protein